MQTNKTEPTASRPPEASAEIRLNDGSMGRIWEIRTGHFGWAHPDGSQGVEDSFRAAEDTLNSITKPVTGAKWSPGEWRVEIYDGEAFIVNSGPSAPRGITSIRLKYAGLNYGESLANAALIAEAGTVANECGKTPRRLLQERDALASTLEGLLAECYSEEDGALLRPGMAAVQAARAALAAVKGGK